MVKAAVKKHPWLERYDTDSYELGVVLTFIVALELSNKYPHATELGLMLSRMRHAILKAQSSLSNAYKEAES